MLIVSAPYNLNDPNDLDWSIQPRNFKKSFSSKMKKSPYGEVIYLLQQTNHGLGADWPTVTVTIFSIASFLLFAIPEGHKKIRESIEEWEKIKTELEKLIYWIFKRKTIIQYPKEILYLDVLTQALKSVPSDAEVIFLNMMEMPLSKEHTSCFNNYKQYLFSFSIDTKIHQIAIDSNRNLLWKNVL